MVMVAPHFARTLEIDPDFSVLLADPADLPRKKNNRPLVIGVAVSMSVFALLVLLVVIFFIVYWRHPRVRAFITGNKVQVAAIGSKGDMSMMSSTSSTSLTAASPPATP